MNIRQYIKMFAQNCLLPLCYWWYSRQKADPGLVVLADAHHQERPESLQPIYEALTEEIKQMEDQKKCAQRNGCSENGESKGLRIQELYLDYQRVSAGEVLRGMLAFMKLYARAGCVVICDNFLPAASCKKKKETQVIQLWHACGAYKKFGYSTTEDIPAGYRGNVFRNTDLVTVSAPACVKPFASAMRLEERCVQPLGIARTDRYFQKSWAAGCRQEFARLYPEAKGKKIVVWAPTFRGNPAQPELLAPDLKRLQKQLGEEWLVLCRVHPHMHETYKEMECQLQTEKLFSVADVLIADYSSLIFEYLMFDKPLILYVPDLEEYERKRGFYLDISEIPAYQTEKEEELAALILEADEKRGMETGRQGMENRKRFLEQYMKNCDGHATERIVGQIIGYGPKQ